MAVRMSEARRRVFFVAPATMRNQPIAAERARVAVVGAAPQEPRSRWSTRRSRRRANG